MQAFFDLCAGDELAQTDVHPASEADVPIDVLSIGIELVRIGNRGRIASGDAVGQKQHGVLRNHHVAVHQVDIGETRAGARASEAQALFDDLVAVRQILCASLIDLGPLSASRA